jgi:hypothetical protein
MNASNEKLYHVISSLKTKFLFVFDLCQVYLLEFIELFKKDAEDDFMRSIRKNYKEHFNLNDNDLNILGRQAAQRLKERINHKNKSNFIYPQYQRVSKSLSAALSFPTIGVARAMTRTFQRKWLIIGSLNSLIALLLINVVLLNYFIFPEMSGWTPPNLNAIVPLSSSIENTIPLSECKNDNFLLSIALDSTDYQNFTTENNALIALSGGLKHISKNTNKNTDFKPTECAEEQVLIQSNLIPHILTASFTNLKKHEISPYKPPLNYQQLEMERFNLKEHKLISYILLFKKKTDKESVVGENSFSSSYNK